MREGSPESSRRAFLGTGVAAILGGVLVSCRDEGAATGPTRSSRHARYAANNYGAKGDGTTDDTPAIQSAVDAAARAGGGDVILQGGAVGYVCERLTLRSGVRLVGDHGRSARLLKRSTSHSWITCAPHSRDLGLRSLDLDARGLSTGNAVQASSGVSGFTASDLYLRSTGHRGVGIAVMPDAHDVTIASCEVGGFAMGISVNSAGEDILVIENHVSDWSERGLGFLARGYRAPSTITVRGNTITPSVAGGRVRQPIQFASDLTSPYRDVTVEDNTVVGRGTDDKDAIRSGSADMISLHNCRDFRVTGNLVTGGGEVGITISRGSAHGRVSGNRCIGNDTAGICIGSSSGPTVTDITVDRNVCLGNGRNFSGQIPAWARSGIVIYDARDIRVSRNDLERDPIHQVYGVSITQAKSISLGRGNSMGRGPLSPVLRREPRGGEIF